METKMALFIILWVSDIVFPIHQLQDNERWRDATTPSVEKLQSSLGKYFELARRLVDRLPTLLYTGLICNWPAVMQFFSALPIYKTNVVSTHNRTPALKYELTKKSPKVLKLIVVVPWCGPVARSKRK